METPIKTLQSLIIGFMGVLLFLGILTFSIKSTTARQTAYEAVRDIEEYGYVVKRIDSLALKTGTKINVAPIETNEGNCYQVTVSFGHFFAIVKLDRAFMYQATTRVVDY